MQGGYFIAPTRTQFSSKSVIHTVACRAVSRQRFSKQVSAVTNTHATIEVLLETVISTRSVQRGYKEDN
jgi:hypothetical protein